MQSKPFPVLMADYETLIARPNEVNQRFYNGLLERYRYPVLTREHTPPFWMYDANPASNPYMYRTIFLKNQYGYGSSIAMFIVLECLVLSWVIQRLFAERAKKGVSL